MKPNQPKTQTRLIELLEKEIKTSDGRYLKVRTQLLQSLTANAQLLEYIQYIEEQLSFYKQKCSFHNHKIQIESSHDTSKSNNDINDKLSIQAPMEKLEIPIRQQNRVSLSDNAHQSGSSNEEISNIVTSVERWSAQRSRDVSILSDSNNPFLHELQLYQHLGTALSSSYISIDTLLSSICDILSFKAGTIYSISHSDSSTQCESSTLSNLQKEKKKMPLNEGILSEVVKHKRCIIISDVSKTCYPFDPLTDDRLLNNTSMDDSMQRTSTIALIPLFEVADDKSNMIGMLELLDTKNKDSDYDNITFKSMMKIVCNLSSIVLSQLLIKRDYEYSNKHKETLLELAKVVADSNSNTNIEDLIESVSKTIYKSVKCDKFALFLVDEIRKELWCNSSSDDVSGIRLPITAGIVGYTVTTGNILNIEDAYADPRFNPDVDRETNYVSKTILCVPIRYNSKIIGAMECINKHDNACFTEADCLLLTKMGDEIAPSLHCKFMESALRILSDGLEDLSTRAYLSQFMRKDIYGNTSGGSNTNNKGNSNIHGTTVRRPSTSLKMLENERLLSHSISNIQFEKVCTWDFDYFVLLEDNCKSAIPMVIFMFSDLQLLEKFDIDCKTLYSFCLAIQKHYYDNPYHNFLHAFSVLHVCYLVLRKTSMIEYLDSLDILSVFIAAIGHDLEHPGLTNAFHINTGSDLALRYNDVSVLENHHAHVCSVLLKQNDLNILSGLRHEERNKVRKAMISTILHTDMSYHQDLVVGLGQMNHNEPDAVDNSECNTNKSNNPMFISHSLVHLGDLSNPVMKWEQSREWSLRVIAEFVAQSHLEKEKNLKNASFIENDDALSVSNMQISFIDYVVKPLWTNVLNVAPELKHRLQVLAENRGNWQTYANNC